MRARICAGMKRYFHTKQTEGLLSNRVRGAADPSPVPVLLAPAGAGVCGHAHGTPLRTAAA